MLTLRNIEWIGDAATGFLRLLDQTRLPTEVAYIDCRDTGTLWDAIKRLVVRGAPAIGVAAAYGCVVAVTSESGGPRDPRARLAAASQYLATSRPTAVNLFWALDRMQRVEPCTPAALLAQARRIHEEDAAMCRAIGEHGLRWMLEGPRAKGQGPLSPGSGGGIDGATKPASSTRNPKPEIRKPIPEIRNPIPEIRNPRPDTRNPPLAILTHCNAGALATGGIGTATAPMYLAHQRGLPLRVYADETRPLLQGARLTAFELASAGIDVTLICDNMAAQVMRERRIDLIIVGADRIAANGDTANKIGTYSLAVLAKHHGIPFLVAAPSSTFDRSLPDGSHIPIEERDGREITAGFGKPTAADLPSLTTYNPAFDVTPADLITAIITERGVIAPVTEPAIRSMLAPTAP